MCVGSHVKFPPKSRCDKGGSRKTANWPSDESFEGDDSVYESFEGSDLVYQSFEGNDLAYETLNCRDSVHESFEDSDSVCDYPSRCKTSLVRQNAELSVSRSQVRFRQKIQKSRT